MNRRVFLEDTGFVINPEIIGQGFTQSEMQTWDNCPELWYLKYNHMMHRVGEFSWPLTYGSWIHSALQEFYASKGKRWSLNTEIKDKQFLSQDALKDESYWRGVADVQMRIYTSHFKNDFKLIKPIAVEEVFSLEWEGIILRGMVDVYAQDLLAKKSEDYYVWDHKTTYRIDKTTVLGWDFRFQFMFYCWLATKHPKWKQFQTKGFMVNAIRKPNIRPNKGETTEGFLQRLQIDMQQRPEFYFYREKLRLKAEDLKHFEDKILRPKILRIKLLLNPKVSNDIKEMLIRNKNTDHCISKFGKPCAFLEGCQKGLSKTSLLFRRREVKHQELITEGADE